MSRDQNCAGSVSVSPQDSQAICACVVVAHCSSGLVFDESGGSHYQHQRLASGFEPSSGAARRALDPVGRGTATVWLWTDSQSSVPMGLPQVTWDAASPRAGAARFTPPRVIGG